jgi:processing peptidase subunit beta
MVLVGAGGVDHGELVKAAEKAFGMLPVSPNPIPLGHKVTQSQTSSARGCTFVTTTFQRHIAVAIKGVSWSLPSYYPMLVMQSIFGKGTMHSALHHSCPRVSWTSSRAWCCRS